jgi:RNA polymerase sigma-70 factor, ECF subfamily
VLGQFAEDLPRVGLPGQPQFDTEQLIFCLERLGERERSVLILSFHPDQTAVDVAQELGLTAANVRVIRHRALLRLRLCMNREELVL